MIIIYTTTDQHQQAKDMCHHLLNLKLAACIQIVKNIESFYMWNDSINISNEYLLIIKTENRNKEKLIAELRSIHNYDIPEIISLEAKIESEKYREWFRRIQQ